MFENVNVKYRRAITSLTAAGSVAVAVAVGVGVFAFQKTSNSTSAVGHLLEVRQAFLAKDLTKMENLVDFNKVSTVIVHEAFASGDTKVDLGAGSGAGAAMLQQSTSLMVKSFKSKISQNIKKLMVSEIRHYLGASRTMDPKMFGISEDKVQGNLKGLEAAMTTSEAFDLEVVPSDIDGHELVKANINETEIYFLVAESPRKLVAIRGSNNLDFSSKKSEGENNG